MGQEINQLDFDKAYENSSEDEPYQRLVEVAEGHGISILNSQAYSILRHIYGDEAEYSQIADSVSVMTDKEVFDLIESFVKDNNRPP
jgi:hypothetical protein